MPGGTRGVGSPWVTGYLGNSPPWVSTWGFEWEGDSFLASVAGISSKQLSDLLPSVQDGTVEAP